MPSVVDVCVLLAFAVLVSYLQSSSALNFRRGGLGAKRPGVYKHRRGPRLGRCFMDLVCDYQVTRDVKLTRLQCVMNSGPVEFKSILQTCMYNATATDVDKEALDQLCNEPEAVKKLNNCFFMAEHPGMKPNKPPVVVTTPKPDVLNDLVPEGEKEAMEVPEANPEDNIVKRSAPFYHGYYEPPPCHRSRGYGCRFRNGPLPDMMPQPPPPPMGPYGHFAPAHPPLPPMGYGHFMGQPPMYHGDFNRRPPWGPGPPPPMPATGYDPFTRLVESCRMSST